MADLTQDTRKKKTPLAAQQRQGGAGGDNTASAGALAGSDTIGFGISKDVLTQSPATTLKNTAANIANKGILKTVGESALNVGADITKAAQATAAPLGQYATGVMDTAKGLLVGKESQLATPSNIEVKQPTNGPLATQSNVKPTPTPSTPANVVTQPDNTRQWGKGISFSDGAGGTAFVKSTNPNYTTRSQLGGPTLEERIKYNATPEAKAMFAKEAAASAARREQLKQNALGDASSGYTGGGINEKFQIAQMKINSDLYKQSIANKTEQAKLGFNIAKTQHEEGIRIKKMEDVRNKNIIDNINELNKTGMATPRDRYRSTKQIGGPQAINFDTFKLFHSDDPTLNEIETKDDLATFLMESGYPKDDFNRIMATSTLQ
jgi:hypothetical protein